MSTTKQVVRRVHGPLLSLTQLIVLPQSSPPGLPARFGRPAHLSSPTLTHDELCVPLYVHKDNTRVIPPAQRQHQTTAHTKQLQNPPTNLFISPPSSSSSPPPSSLSPQHSSLPLASLTQSKSGKLVQCSERWSFLSLSDSLSTCRPPRLSKRTWTRVTARSRAHHEVRTRAPCGICGIIWEHRVLASRTPGSLGTYDARGIS